jgi:hypothetical protein
MRQTKLLTILRTLTTRERTRWRQYVHADFFNRHSHLRALCDELLPYAPAFEHPALEKRTVYARVYGAQKTYNDLKINNLISDLLALLLDFLAFQRYERDEVQGPLRAAESLLARDLTGPAAEAVEKARLVLERRPDRSAAWWQAERQWWEISEQLDNYSARREAGRQLPRLADAADCALVLEKLRLGCAMIGRNALAVVQADFHPRGLADVRRWCSEDPLLGSQPAIAVYLHALDLLERQSLEAYRAFTGLLEQHPTIFPADELTTLYHYALNWGIRRINDGQGDGYGYVLDLYQRLLERGLLLRRGRLSQWTYKNITTAGLRTGNFAWTEAFLHRYREALPPAERDNAFAYNLAALLFEKNDFAGSLQTLQDVEFTDFTYHLGAKIIQLKSYFQLDEAAALQALLTTTRQLLRRNRSLSAYGKTANLHFLKMLGKLVPWRQRRGLLREKEWRRQAASLRARVESLHPLANKDWLLEQLA